MGSKASRRLQDDEIAQIQRETGFTPNQIVRLYSRFTSLDKNDNGYLMKDDFLRIPELAINPLAPRIINLFCTQQHDDRTDNGNAADTVNFRQFMNTLARFRPIKKKPDHEANLNSREEKLRFAFNMYDLDNDDRISRFELLSVLKMMVGANISEEQLGSIADRTIQEADEDQDGSISFLEFTKVMLKVDVEQKMSIRFLG